MSSHFHFIHLPRHLTLSTPRGFSLIHFVAIMMILIVNFFWILNQKWMFWHVVPVQMNMKKTRWYVWQSFQGKGLWSSPEFCYLMAFISQLVSFVTADGLIIELHIKQKAEFLFVSSYSHIFLNKHLVKRERTFKWDNMSTPHMLQDVQLADSVQLGAWRLIVRGLTSWHCWFRIICLIRQKWKGFYSFIYFL